MVVSDQIKKYLLDSGADLVGFGDLSEIPEDIWGNMPYGICIALAIDPRVVNGIGEGPTKDYLKAFNSLNDKLDKIVEDGAEYIKSLNYEAFPQSRAVVKVDEAGINSILPHKTVATRSGLGWIGKCAVLVTKKYGSAVRLSTILTNAPLITDAPIDEAHCGNCKECVTACPAQAVKGVNWSTTKCRDDFLDAIKCRAATREIAKRAVGIEMSLCGKCIYVCPFTQKYISEHI